MSRNAPLRVALAGLGLHGERYARHLLAGDVPGVQLAAVYTRDRDKGRRFAADHQLRLHQRLEDWCADPEADFLIAVLPPSLHPHAVELAAQERRPILVEKPLGNSVSAAERAVVAAREAKILAMVAHTQRFNSVVGLMAQRLPELGEISLLALSQRFEPINRDWLDRPEEGGLAFNTGVHGLDLIRFLSGREMGAISAQSIVLPGRRTESAITALIQLEPGPALATLDCARTTLGRSCRIEICGSAGQLSGDQILGTVRSITAAGSKEQVVTPQPTLPRAISAFKAALESQSPSPVPLEDGLKAVAAAERVRAAAGGARVAPHRSRAE